jgi:chorismate lyase/3-hydroxybenzoate synthase
VAAVIHGEYAPPDRPWLQFHSHLPPVDGEARIEVMFANRETTLEAYEMYSLLCTEDFMVGACRLDEDGGDTLTARSERIYNTLFEIIRDYDYPHILRTWNIIEDINRDQDGLERYRKFCLGRYESFQRFRPDLAGRYPAASAVGSRSGGLLVYFIAARSPGIPVENPVQVSAFNYPSQYGPRSPSFSRALVRRWEGGRPDGGDANLYISGTASIRGHETWHPGDLIAQVNQTIDNLDSLTAEASRKSRIEFALRRFDSLMKCYVRNPDDLPEIRKAVAARLGEDAEVLFLRADVCREALLVEIDGVLSA